MAFDGALARTLTDASVARARAVVAPTGNVASTVNQEGDVALQARELAAEARAAINAVIPWLDDNNRSLKFATHGEPVTVAIALADSITALIPDDFAAHRKALLNDMILRLVDCAETYQTSLVEIHYQLTRGPLEKLSTLSTNIYHFTAQIPEGDEDAQTGAPVEDLYSQKVMQYNPGWVGTTTANTDLTQLMGFTKTNNKLWGAYEFGALKAGDMAGAQERMDLAILSALGGDIGGMKSVIQDIMAGLRDGSMTPAAMDQLTTLIRELGGLRRLVDTAATPDAVANLDAVLGDKVAAVMDALQTVIGSRAAPQSLIDMALNFTRGVIADFGLQEQFGLRFAVLEKAASPVLALEGSVAALHEQLTALLESTDITAAQRESIQNILDQLAARNSGTPLSFDLLMDLKGLAQGLPALSGAVTAVFDNTVALKAAEQGVTYAAMASVYSAMEAMHTLATGQEIAPALRAQLIETLAILDRAPFSLDAAVQLVKLQPVLAAADAHPSVQAALAAAQTSLQQTVALQEITLARTHGLTVEGVRAAVQTVIGLEALQTSITAHPQLAPPGFSAAKIGEIMADLKASPAGLAALVSLHSLAMAQGVQTGQSPLIATLMGEGSARVAQTHGIPVDTVQTGLGTLAALSHLSVMAQHGGVSLAPVQQAQIQQILHAARDNPAVLAPLVNALPAAGAAGVLSSPQLVAHLSTLVTAVAPAAAAPPAPAVASIVASVGTGVAFSSPAATQQIGLIAASLPAAAAPAVQVALGDLQQVVQNIAPAGANGPVPATAASVELKQETIDTLRTAIQQGQIPPDKAAQITAILDKVAGDPRIVVIVPEPVSPSAQPSPHKDHDHGHDHKHGPCTGGPNCPHCKDAFQKANPLPSAEALVAAGIVLAGNNPGVETRADGSVLIKGADGKVLETWSADRVQQDVQKFSDLEAKIQQLASGGSAAASVPPSDDPIMRAAIAKLGEVPTDSVPDALKKIFEEKCGPGLCDHDHGKPLSLTDTVDPALASVDDSIKGLELLTGDKGPASIAKQCCPTGCVDGQSCSKIANPQFEGEVSRLAAEAAHKAGADHKQETGIDSSVSRRRRSTAITQEAA